MAKITVNPQAEASASFDIARPGVYRMRVEGSANFPAVQEFVSEKGNTCIKVRSVYADPTAVLKENGDPAKLPGSIIDSSLVIAPADKQGKLRSFVEACGLSWSDFDTDNLVGLEFEAMIGVEEYKGEKKNVIKRYLKPGA